MIAWFSIVKLAGPRTNTNEPRENFLNLTSGVIVLPTLCLKLATLFCGDSVTGLGSVSMTTELNSR